MRILLVEDDPEQLEPLHAALSQTGHIVDGIDDGEIAKWLLSEKDYDLLIYVANWPQKRATHWKSLLKARAIENQSFTIGLNRVGTDSNGLQYSGDSQVINPAGEIIFHAAHQASNHQCTLSKTELENIRKKLPFLQGLKKKQE